MSPIQIIFADDIKPYCDHVASKASRTAGVIKFDKAYCCAELETKLKTGNYNLVFLSDELDDVDGPNYLQLLVARYPNVSFVAVTRKREKTYLTRFKQAGCKGIIDRRNDASDIKDSYKPVMTRGWYLSTTISHELFDEASEKADTDGKLAKANLSPNQKEILAMLLEDMKYKDIGEKLDISADDAKARGYKIRVKLKAVGLNYLLDRKRGRKNFFFIITSVVKPTL